MEPTDTSQPDYFHRVVDCQWACPAHTDVPEYIRLIAQGEFTEAYMVNRESNVFPGHSGPRLRPALRARLPPRPHRRKAGRHLPAEARRRRSTRRHQRAAAQCAAREERQAHRLHRRRPGLAHRRQRSAASGLRGHDLRAVRRRRRLDAHQYSGIPAARERARRGNRLHRRHGRGSAPEFARQEHAPAAATPKNSMRCSSASGAPKGKELELPGRHDTEPRAYRHHLARIGRFRPCRQDRRARAHHRRRQYRHGLLPHVRCGSAPRT